MLKFTGLKNTFYSLSKSTGYVMTVVLTLSITLGALIAMFNLNYQLLAAPLPYPNADRLVKISSQRFNKSVIEESRSAPYPLWFELYQQQDAYFEKKALMAYTVSVERRLPDSPTLTTVATTPEMLTLLDAPMALGRHFTAEEGLYSMTPVAIINHRTWQTIYQQDPNIVGKTINIMEVDFKIIGVLAKDFVEPSIYKAGWQTDLWLPFDYDDMPPPFRKRWDGNRASAMMVGLLKSDVALAKAEHELSAWAAARFKDENHGLPGMENIELKLRLNSLSTVIVGAAGQQSLLLFSAALALLLMAVASITNLILARAANLQRTHSIHIALGAQPRHIFSSLWIEILSLMLMASLLGIAIAVGVLELLKTVAEGHIPRLQELSLNTVTIVFALCMAFLLALIFAAIVSRQINYRKLNSLLQSSGKGVGLQISAKVRKLLIVSQVVLTGILLVVSLQILLQSLQQLQQQPGFDTDDQYQVRVSIATLWNSTTHDERKSYFLQLADDLKKNPAVVRVALTSRSPVDFFTPLLGLVQSEPGSEHNISALGTVSDAAFFDIVNIPLVMGRHFSEMEVREDAKLVLVNETLARQLQTNGDVVGKMLFHVYNSSSEGYLIVGVLQDLNLPGETEGARYFQAGIVDGPELLIQVQPGHTLAPRDVNRLAEKIHPELKVFDMRTASYSMSLLTERYSLLAKFTAALALLALVLAAIGIYGLLSYSVQLRRFELGIRMAIGARPIIIFIQILRDNIIPVVVGLVVAFIAVLALWLWLQQTPYVLHLSYLGWFLPSMLIISLTASSSLLSVWQVIRQPASHALNKES